MNVDWAFVQAAMVVVSFEFLVLGVIVLIIRARRVTTSAQALPEPVSHYVPEPALLAGPYLQFSAPISVAPPSPKFMAVGTEIDYPETDEDFGACWNQEADWAELIDDGLVMGPQQGEMPITRRIRLVQPHRNRLC